MPLSKPYVSIICILCAYTLASISAIAQPIATLASLSPDTVIEAAQTQATVVDSAKWDSLWQQAPEFVTQNSSKQAFAQSMQTARGDNRAGAPQYRVWQKIQRVWFDQEPASLAGKQCANVFFISKWQTTDEKEQISLCLIDKKWVLTGYRIVDTQKNTADTENNYVDPKTEPDLDIFSRP